jgi:TP901 family phage tail tape measure protein
MANNTIGSMTAVVRATAGQFAQDVNQIKSDVRSLKQTVESSQPKGGVFDSLKSGAGMALGLLGISSAANVASRSIRGLIDTSREFSRSMAESTSIMSGVTAELRKGLEDTAKQVSFSTKFSAAESAKAYFFLASAGLDVKQSIAALPVVAKFAQAGMFDLSKATDLLATSQASLGMNSDNAAQNMQSMSRIANVLVQANNVALGSIEDFAVGLAGASGAIRLVDMSVEEAAAVLAAFAMRNVRGEEAATQLSIVLRDLQASAIGNAGAFEKAGIEVFDASGKFRHMADIMGQLEAAMEPLSHRARKSMMMDLGFQEKSVLSIMKLLGSSNEIREFQAGMQGIEGLMDKVANDNIPAFDRAMNKLRAGWDNLKTTFGTPILEKVAAAIEAVVDSLAKVDGSLIGVTAEVIAFSAAFGATLLIVPKLITGLIAITRALRALAAGQAIVAALSGPAGIASLVIAAGAGALAVAGLDQAFAGLDAKMAAVSKASKEFSIEGPGNKLQEDVEAIAQTTEAMKALEEQMKRGKQVTEQMRTPIEIFRDSIDELLGLLDAGSIQWETYTRAVAAAGDTLANATDEKEKMDRLKTTPGVGAAVGGTTEGFSAIQSAARLQQDMQRRQEEMQKQTLAEEKKQTEQLRLIESALDRGRSTVVAADI